MNGSRKAIDWFSPSTIQVPPSDDGGDAIGHVVEARAFQSVMSAIPIGERVAERDVDNDVPADAIRALIAEYENICTTIARERVVVAGVEDHVLSVRSRSE